MKMIDINPDMQGIDYRVVWYNNECTSINRQEGCGNIEENQHRSYVLR